jgi:hypothetical protein
MQWAVSRSPSSLPGLAGHQYNRLRLLPIGKGKAAVGVEKLVPVGFDASDVKQVPASQGEQRKMKANKGLQRVDSGSTK